MQKPVLFEPITDDRLSGKNHPRRLDVIICPKVQARELYDEGESERQTGVFSLTLDGA